MMDQYLIPVWETITASWEKVKGSKLTFWGAFITIFLVSIGFAILTAITKSLPVINSLIQIVSQVITFLLQIGVLYIGIRRAYDQPIAYEQMFRSFEGPVVWRIILLYILQVIIFIPLVLILIIPSAIVGAYELTGPLAYFLLALCYIIGFFAIVFVAVRMMLAMAFVLDKITGPWQSIKLSFEATRGNFWRLIALFILEFIIFIISLIPLGIGLIWSLPLFAIMYGVMYKRLIANVRSA